MGSSIEVSAEVNADKVRRVIACSGKIYYDLVKARAERKNGDVALLRVEQLYPFPHKAFAAEMKKYPNATEVVWCQDEPQNQGAWFFVQHYIHENMVDGQKLGYAGRPASASPAVGYAHLHQEQQKALLEQAYGKLKGFVLTICRRNTWKIWLADVGCTICMLLSAASCMKRSSRAELCSGPCPS